MPRWITSAVLLLGATLLLSHSSAQTPAPKPKFEAFEVATVKPMDHDPQGGRYLLMSGPHRFVAKDFTLKLLIAAAYDLNSRTISGGPAWIDSQHFNIEAITPGESKPDRKQQMAMLRRLLTERFALTFHREDREFSIYELSVDSGGPKLKESKAAPDESPALLSTVYPQKIVMPARNASMEDFVAVLQRAVLDRPVVNKTGLSGRYDFDLEWAPDETQFGGEVPVAPSDATSPPLFTAIREQIGLKLVATRGPVSALVVDSAVKPQEN